jgi:hypothetical protein
MLVNIPIKTFTSGLNENGSGSNSDTLVIDPFTVTLTSDYRKGSGPEFAEEAR